MANVKGVPDGKYVARAAVGKDLFYLYKVEDENPLTKDYFSVRIPSEMIRKIGRRKLEGENLSSAVTRILQTGLQSLENKKGVVSENGK